MRIIKTVDRGFQGVIKDLLERGRADTTVVEAQVREILEGVRTGGDKTLNAYTKKFDGVATGVRIKVSERTLSGALKKIPKKDVDTLRLAASRIEAFHRMQLRDSWYTVEEDGTTVGQKITPIERVGIYVPGGKAAYPSTVLMNAVPAKVAGVGEIIMVTPPSKRGIDSYVLAAAKLSGVDSVYRAGGAQAIAALAFGTDTVPKVDKIVGPGNIYVATAKRLVFGTVGIDMVAGPSEILVINDGTGDPEWIAADLLGQAEHDELASSILLTTSVKTAGAVKRAVRRQLAKLPRRKIATESSSRYGLIIIVRGLAEAVRLSNRIAPEHLELFVKDPAKVLEGVRNAGAVFLGRDTPEALGDYLAGPNHTLPTGGTARFSSPLGVEDFIKRSSVIGFSREGFEKLRRPTERFARIEGFDAHARSVSIRAMKKTKS
jgi:histidinol dehydrogenase